MRQLLVIETRDSAEERDPARMVDLAVGISGLGIPAAIFLTENGAFSARRGHEFGAATCPGVDVYVDSFALKERGIPAEDLADGVNVGEIDLIVEHLLNGSTVMWR